MLQLLGLHLFEPHLLLAEFADRLIRPRHRVVNNLDPVAQRLEVRFYGLVALIVLRLLITIVWPLLVYVDLGNLVITMIIVVAVVFTGQLSQMHTSDVVLLTFLGELYITSGRLKVVMLLFLTGHIVIRIIHFRQW